MKIGLLFGSFDPVHIGHTAVGNYLCEHCELDEVWLVVTPLNPLKAAATAAAAHRLAMARLAAEAYPKFRACDIEFHLPQPTYTVHTMDTLRKQHPACEFYLMIGADNWLQLPQWRDSHRLYTDYRILVYPRPGYDVAIPAEQFPHVQQVDAPQFDISSTFLRRAIAHNEDVSGLLLPAVWNYIKEHRLYQ